MFETIDCNTDILDPETEFKYYDLWEPYIENHDYSTLGYHVEVHKFNNGSYITWQNKLTEEELKELLPYCTCPVCTAWYWNPMRFFMCRCCHGCIGGAFTPNPRYVYEAKQKMNQSKTE